MSYSAIQNIPGIADRHDQIGLFGFIADHIDRCSTCQSPLDGSEVTIAINCCLPAFRNLFQAKAFPTQSAALRLLIGQPPSPVSQTYPMSIRKHFGSLVLLV